jgi:hypothetical protein
MQQLLDRFIEISRAIPMPILLPVVGLRLLKTSVEKGFEKTPVFLYVKD